MIVFMLASTFVRERQIDLDSRQTIAVITTAEVRLLTATPDGIALDGERIENDALAAALSETPDATVAVKPAGGVSMQRVIDVSDLARAAGAFKVVLAR